MSASLKKGPTGGPRIVPFYVLEKVWCTAKKCYARHTL